MRAMTAIEFANEFKAKIKAAEEAVKKLAQARLLKKAPKSQDHSEAANKGPEEVKITG